MDVVHNTIRYGSFSAAVSTREFYNGEKGHRLVIRSSPEAGALLPLENLELVMTRLQATEVLQELADSLGITIITKGTDA